VASATSTNRRSTHCGRELMSDQHSRKKHTLLPFVDRLQYRKNKNKS